MARPLRLEYADAAHHVMSRGIEGRRICTGDADRNLWVEILGRAAERFGWRVFAFCLLDNHFHLFLEFGRDEAKARRADRGFMAEGLGRKLDDPARAKCAYAVREASGARNRDLAAALGYRSASSVTTACRRIREAARSGKVRRELAALAAHAAEER